MKGELREFATQIAPKCEMLEVGFNVDAIMEHVKDYFSEQRRYAMKKNKKVFLSQLLLCHSGIRIKESCSIIKHLYFGMDENTVNG